MLTSFFSQFTPHLTKSQLAAKAARENCGKPGRRKGDLWTPRRRNRSCKRSRHSGCQAAPSTRSGTSGLEDQRKRPIPVIKPVSTGAAPSPRFGLEKPTRSPAT
jgi:hypothetical protein